MITFMPHTESVTALGFSPDGARLVSVSNDGGVKLWDVSHLGPSGLVWQVEKAHRLGLSHAQFAPDGTVIYTGGSDGFSRGVVKAWAAADGELRARTDPEAHPEAESYTLNAFTVSLCGRFLAYGGGIMTMPTDFVVARASDLVPIRRVPGHQGAVGVFIPQEKGFVSGSADQSVRMWDWDSATCHGTIKLRGVIRGLATARDGKCIAIAGGAIIHRYTAAPVGAPEPRTEPEKIGDFRGHTKRVECIEFSPDGKRLASASADGTVRVWDVSTASELRAFNPKLGPLHWVTFSPDGLTLAFSSQKGHVGLLDLDD
jgi:WD40 repeat protein